jgi:hypothetical protein
MHRPLGGREYDRAKLLAVGRQLRLARTQLDYSSAAIDRRALARRVAALTRHFEAMDRAGRRSPVALQER